jgi:hypothetical protein
LTARKSPGDSSLSGSAWRVPKNAPELPGWQSRILLAVFASLASCTAFLVRLSLLWSKRFAFMGPFFF